MPNWADTDIYPYVSVCCTLAPIWSETGRHTNDVYCQATMMMA